MSDEAADRTAGRARLRRRATVLLAAALVTYLATAYLVAPGLWRHYARRHPSLMDVPGITHTGSGIPGDPVNVSLIGTEEEVLRIMKAARWSRADPLSVRNDLKIAAATVLKRSYEGAPVSSLYLYGRKEDLAFERPVGRDPRQRHHVRFWRTLKVDPDGRPVWVGSAVFDKGVGVSHRTGQVTHHTAPDVDAERDTLFRDLEGTGGLAEVYAEDGFHLICKGRNGGGDPWYTDGRLFVGVVKKDF